MNNDIKALLEAIRIKLSALPEGSCARVSYLAHIRALARWPDEPMDYPKATDVDFPDSIGIAYAVCHPDCGMREFIVDGSSQECQNCGGQVFRTEVAEYRLKTGQQRTSASSVPRKARGRASRGG